MFIANWMTPDPVTITPETAVPEAAALLRQHRFRHLPVVDADRRLVGMVTDRDLRSACPSSLLEEDERQHIEDRIRQTRVQAIMSTDFVSLYPESTLDDALILFKTRSIGALPVVNEDGRVVGILSLNDMMHAWRQLFGLGERGSALVAVEDSGEEDTLGRLVLLLARQGVELTRLLRTGRDKDRPAMIYLRVKTMNIRGVHRLLEQAGLTIHHPLPKLHNGDDHA